MNDLHSRNLTAIAKRRVLLRSLRQYKLPELKQLSFDVLGMNVPKEYPNRKQSYIEQIITYYFDTSNGTSVLKQADFKHETYYRCRKRISNYIETLPANF